MKPNKTAPQALPGRYSLIRRTNGTYYSHNKVTLQRQSLKTRDKNQAIELLNVLNVDDSDLEHARAMAELYLKKAGRIVSDTTWQEAMDACSAAAGKEEATKQRHREAFRSKHFNPIRAMTIAQTHPDDLRRVLRTDKVTIVKFLRTLQNYAVAQGWLTSPLLPPTLFRVQKKKEARAMTQDEFRKIIAAEQNPERKLYYQMVWATGASQTDCANLRAENFDRATGVLTYYRRKTKSLCRLAFQGSIEKLLGVLPSEGYLFPNIQKLSSKRRSSEFTRRCRTQAVQVAGISLHSGRYAWAERAALAGFTLRQAQAALGHRSEVVAQAYAKKAEIVCSALPDEE